VDVFVGSRLGLWWRALRLPAEGVVRVYPDVRQIARYALLARRDKLSALGVRRSRRLGTDNEFERLRDYAEGDEPRHMDWRATARRRKLTVRAHQANQSQRIIFLIDCGRMMAGDTGAGLSPLDHAFNAMLLLAHVALLRGDQVGMLAFSDRVRAYVPPSGGPRRINRLVHGVHDVFPELVEPRYDRAFVELEKRCRKRSLVVLMTNVFDDVNAQIIGDHLGKPTDFALGWTCRGHVGGEPPLPAERYLEALERGTAPSLGCFNLTLHQTAIYDFLSTLVLLGVLLWLGRRAHKTGFMILVFTIWYSAMRVITDFLRVDKRYFGLTGSQLMTMAVGLVCVALLLRYRGAPPRFAAPPGPDPALEPDRPPPVPDGPPGAPEALPAAPPALETTQGEGETSETSPDRHAP